MLCNIEDLDIVADVLLDESVHPLITDDASESEEAVIQVLTLALSSANTYVLMPNIDTVILFMPVNSTTYDIHINVKKGPYRKDTIKSIIKCGHWMMRNTQVRKFVAYVPDGNPQVTAIVEKCQMKLEGNITSSFLKNGKLRDTKVYGMTDKEFLDTIGG